MTNRENSRCESLLGAKILTNDFLLRHRAKLLQPMTDAVASSTHWAAYGLHPVKQLSMSLS